MKRIVDLTMSIHEGMQTFPAHWHPVVEITQLGRHGIENRETRKIVLGTHTGTHIDAPRHFVPGGRTVDQISLEQINGRATLVDMSHLPARASVDVPELAAATKNHSVERLIMRFDGCKRLGTMEYYTDHQWLTQDACRWLVERGCRLLGFDIPMPDNPNSGPRSEEDSPNHKILLGNNVILLEYLVHLSAIGVPEFDLIVAPLKIRDGDGAPARCFAVVED
jgi:kynurenine formamidase